MLHFNQSNRRLYYEAANSITHSLLEGVLQSILDVERNSRSAQFPFEMQPPSAMYAHFATSNHCVTVIELSNGIMMYGTSTMNVLGSDNSSINGVLKVY